MMGARAARRRLIVAGSEERCRNVLSQAILSSKQRRWTDSAVFRQPQVPLVGSVVGD